MKKNTIDFLIIGAGKSGTTSLFRYLSAHPDIFMPGEKELSFFTRDEYYTRGLNWCLKEWFSGAGSSQILGEASPQYMTYSVTPFRIRETLPRVKLIAILRNPIDRAYSHYRHLTRSGREMMTFSECVDRRLALGSIEERAIETNRGWHSEYIADGEYGRILSAYFECFSRDQLKCLFFEDLERRPHEIVAKLYQWLNVDPKFVPSNLGKTFNAGGRLRFPRMTGLGDRLFEWGAQRPAIKRSLDFVGLRRPLRRAWISFSTTLAVNGECAASMAADIRQCLAQHYASDVAQLEKLLDVQVPWPEFSGDPSSKPLYGKKRWPTDARNQAA